MYVKSKNERMYVKSSSSIYSNSRPSKINECDSDEETERDESRNSEINLNLGISTDDKLVDSQDMSFLSTVVDLIYESVIDLEEQVRDLFRSDERSNSVIDRKRMSDNSRLDKRKTVVMRNVHHFQQPPSKNKRVRKKTIRKMAYEEKKVTNNNAMVKIFDRDFDKVFNIMLGINRSIYWLFESPYYQITDNDYTAKFEYNNQWYSQTGVGAKIFTFTDYAPKIFENIRKLDGIKNEDYAKTLGPSNIFKYIWSNNLSTFKELCSTGKSGSLFYYTEDGKYMLKTIHKDEFVKMREILRPYHEHVVNCPESVINRFYGLHKINYTENNKDREQYLVIMNNMFGHYEVDMRYDLKGSTTGRTTVFPEGVKPDKTVALKDNNFVESGEAILLEDDQRAELLNSLKETSEFLGQSAILDYSTLVGVVDLRDKRSLLKAGMLDPEDPVAELLIDNPKRPPYRGCYFSQDRNYLYIVGVIDTLTNYTTKKKFEYHFKRIKHGQHMS